jgi:hypothetical protein
MNTIALEERRLRRAEITAWFDALEAANHRRECVRRLPLALWFVLMACYSVTFGEGWLLPLFNLVAMVLCMDILIGDLLDVIEG